MSGNNIGLKGRDVMIKDFKYNIIEKPILQWEDNGQWILTQNFHYETPDGKFCLPEGLVTDFASIPRALRIFFSSGAILSRSALVHDWLYLSRSVSRKEADITFRELLKVEGVNLSTRYLFYWAVRLFGASHYNKSKVVISQEYL